MTNERFGTGLFVLLFVGMGFVPIQGKCEGLTATAGELIVAFENEALAVLEIDNCMVTSVYPALNGIFS